VPPDHRHELQPVHCQTPPGTAGNIAPSKTDNSIVIGSVPHSSSVLPTPVPIVLILTRVALPLVV